MIVGKEFKKMFNYFDMIFLGHQEKQERRSWTDQRVGEVTSATLRLTSVL